MNKLYTVSGDYIKVKDEHIINNKCEYFQDINNVNPSDNNAVPQTKDNTDVEGKYDKIATSRHYDKDNKLNNVKLDQVKESTDNSDIEDKYKVLLNSRHYGAK